MPCGHSDASRGGESVHIFCKHLSPADESACHPKPKYLRQVERNPFDAAQRFGQRPAAAFFLGFNYQRGILREMSVETRIYKTLLYSIVREV